MDRLRDPGVDDGPLLHHASCMSALSDADAAAHDANLRDRESLVSVDSRHGPSDVPPSPSAPLWPGALSYKARPARGSVLQSFASRALSRGRRSPVLPPTPAAPAAGDDAAYDLSLLRSAAPPGHDARYDVIPEEEPALPVFDVTSALGPLGSHDADSVAKFQEQEARGMLTGGLGRGFDQDPRLRLRHSELLSSPLSLSRSLARRASTKPVDRAATIREAGQDEANRRG